MKAKEQPPFVLHVDDQPESLRSWQDQANATKQIRVKVKHPQAVSDQDLSEATVVLVDVRLDHWEERDNVAAISLKPTNGLALLAVLQEQALKLSNGKPQAFALYTGALNEIARGLVPRPHIIARAHNLEWVFDKNEGDNRARLDQLTQLAEALVALPNPWPGKSPESARQALSEWLALPEDDMGYDWVWRSVLDCRPPLHEFATHTHGIGVLRWMLQKILPYPCFLLDDEHVAARLCVDPTSLRQELEANATLRRLFKPAVYSGRLGGFLGRRWWRSSVEGVVFGLVPENPANLELLHQRLKGIAPALTFFDEKFAFPVLDENFRVKPTLAHRGDVQEIVPDDWPPFADTAWALRADVEAAPTLRAIAVPAEE